MGPDKKPVLGGLEFEILDILWSRGESTVREVMPHLSRPLAYTTVMTALDRLYRKEFVTRRNSDLAFAYTPRLSREEWARMMIGTLIHTQQSQIPPAEGASYLVGALSQADETLLDDLLKKIEDKRRDISGKKDS